MCKWVEFLASFLQDGIMPRDNYGDWCVPPESTHLIHSEDPDRKTAGALLGTAYFYRILSLVVRYAAILGKPDDAKRFGNLAEDVKLAFNNKFLNEKTHQYDNGTQTANVLPLAFGMVPKEHMKPVFENLVDNILVKNEGHIATGLVGGQWLLRVLSDFGRPDVAHTLATQTSYPSWGYMVEKGATTIWELWNGDTANPAMNSHNHLMLVGDLGIWFYEYVAGIRPDPDQPGFKHILLRPYPPTGLAPAKASHESLYGPIVSEWKIEDDTFHWKITVPPNTTATAYVPTTAGEDISEGGRPAHSRMGVRKTGDEDGVAVFQLEAGAYEFRSPFSRSTWRSDQQAYARCDTR